MRLQTVFKQVHRVVDVTFAFAMANEHPLQVLEQLSLPSRRQARGAHERQLWLVSREVCSCFGFGSSPSTRFAKGSSKPSSRASAMIFLESSFFNQIQCFRCRAGPSMSLVPPSNKDESAAGQPSDT